MTFRPFYCSISAKTSCPSSRFFSLTLHPTHRALSPSTRICDNPGRPSPVRDTCTALSRLELVSLILVQQAGGPPRCVDTRMCVVQASLKYCVTGSQEMVTGGGPTAAPALWSIRVVVAPAVDKRIAGQQMLSSLRTRQVTWPRLAATSATRVTTGDQWRTLRDGWRFSRYSCPPFIDVYTWNKTLQTLLKFSLLLINRTHLWIWRVRNELTVIRKVTFIVYNQFPLWSWE